MRPRPHPLLSRRTALVGAAVAATAACTPYTVEQPTVPAPRRRPRGIDPDVALAATVLADEQRMVDLIDATVREHADLGEALAAAREVHRTHVELLNDAVPEDATDAVSPAVTPSVSPEVTPSPESAPASGSPSKSPQPTSSATTVPRRRREALEELATAEDALALLDKRSAFAAQSGAFARVLASMAAAAAQQSVLVTELRAGRRRR